MPWLREKIRDNPITEEIKALQRGGGEGWQGSADDVTDDVIRQSVEDAGAKATSPAENLAIQGEREFGIPLTQGQRTLDDAALSAEERARVGMQGEGAQRVMRGFETGEQIPAINAARETVESSIGGQQGAALLW